MADPNEFDHVMPENTARRRPEEPIREALPLRLLYMILIWVMLSLAGTVIGVLAVMQLVMLAISDKKPNPRIAELGTDVGIWMAKAARYQTGASEEKPWPWSDLD